MRPYERSAVEHIGTRSQFYHDNATRRASTEATECVPLMPTTASIRRTSTQEYGIEYDTQVCKKATSAGRIQLEFTSGYWTFVVFVRGKRIGEFQLQAIQSDDEEIVTRRRNWIKRKIADTLAASHFMGPDC